jgi:hypothetical protein
LTRSERIQLSSSAASGTTWSVRASGLIRGQAVDLALDGKDHIASAHRSGDERRPLFPARGGLGEIGTMRPNLKDLGAF